MAPHFPDRFRPYLLALIVVAVFANSFGGVFVFDEWSSITSNPGIKHFWPPDWLLKYPNCTRPVVSFSFAVNYAIHGFHHWSYHLFNIAIHAVSSVTLFAIMRRTFLSARLRQRYGRDANRLAFLIALFWAIHPLQTASVTYVVQRCESMMGMFFLLTLYYVICAHDSKRPQVCKGLAILFCALGMGSKQVMFVAPLLILCYDRTFISGTFLNALKRGRWLYPGMLATSIIVITGTMSIPKDGATAGFAVDCVTPYKYFLTQCGVIPYYFKLAFWPDRLCLDYVWPFVQSPAEVWPGILFLGMLGLASLYATIRNSPWGFVGAWFFVILAPTSSFMPIQDPIFEHRMYLPLASIIVLVVIGVYEIARRLLEKGWDRRKTQIASAAGFQILLLAMCVRTIVRNCDYYKESAIWGQVATWYPKGQRGANNYGNALAWEGRHEEAVKSFEACLKISPDYPDAHFNLGVELNKIGRQEESIKHYKRLIEINPEYPNAHALLADELADKDFYGEAAEHYELELKRDPTNQEIKKKLEDALDQLNTD